MTTWWPATWPASSPDPKVQRSEIQPLTPAEAAQLFAAAAEDRLLPLWLLVTALGLRRGEAGAGSTVPCSPSMSQPPPAAGHVRSRHLR